MRAQLILLLLIIMSPLALAHDGNLDDGHDLNQITTNETSHQEIGEEGEGCSLGGSCGDVYTLFDQIVEQTKDMTDEAILIAILAVLLSITLILHIQGKISPTLTIILAITTVILSLTGYLLYLQLVSPTIIGCTATMPDGTIVAHCHYDIKLTICGEEKIIANDTGDLDRFHTHTTPNNIHLHQDKAVPNLDFVTLNNIFSDLGLQLDETSVEDPQTGLTYHNGAQCLNSKTNRVNVEIKRGNTYIEVGNYLDKVLIGDDQIRISYE